MKKMFLYVPLIVFAILLSCAQPKEPVGPNWTLSLMTPKKLKGK